MEKLNILLVDLNKDQNLKEFYINIFNKFSTSNFEFYSYQELIEGKIEKFPSIQAIIIDGEIKNAEKPVVHNMLKNLQNYFTSSIPIFLIGDSALNHVITQGFSYIKIKKDFFIESTNNLIELKDIDLPIHYKRLTNKKSISFNDLFKNYFVNVSNHNKEVIYVKQYYSIFDPSIKSIINTETEYFEEAVIKLGNKYMIYYDFINQPEEYIKEIVTLIIKRSSESSYDDFLDLRFKKFIDPINNNSITIQQIEETDVGF